MDKNTYKTLADAVGMPDNVDKENIQKIILRYEKKHPGYIKHARDEAKAEYAAEGGDKQKFGVTNKQAAGRVIFELPEELYHDIEAYMPTVFRETKHFRWFVKNFKELMVPEVY